MLDVTPLARASGCSGLYVHDSLMHSGKGVQCQAARMETECPDHEPSQPVALAIFGCHERGVQPIH